MMKSFLVGTYTTGTSSPGIWRVTLEQTGLSNPEPVIAMTDPSWLVLSGNTLFAINENLRPGEHGQLLRMIRREDGRYLPGGCVSTGGENPCHAALSPDGKTICVSNYTGGSAAVFRTEDLSRVSFHQGGGLRSRPVCAHAHQALYHQGGWLICDLGGDCIWRMEEDGSCRETYLRLPAGTGPRHAVIRGNRIYVITELTNELITLDLEDGQILSRTSVLGDPAVQSAAAELQLFGGRLFASNRGENTVSVFSLEDPDRPQKTGVFPVGGRNPRDILVTENGILCACAEGVTWLKQDGDSFRPASAVSSPSAVRILAE